MKRILVIVGVVLLFILGISSCKVADSAEVALVVDQIGTNKGVPNIEMASGVIFYFPPTIWVIFIIISNAAIFIMIMNNMIIKNVF